MKQKPQQKTQEHRNTWFNPTTYPVMKEECLCWNCKLFHPGESIHCGIARNLFSICKVYNISILVARCAKWEKK